MSSLSKRCTKCGATKPLNEFGVDKKAKDGLNYWCRQCNCEARRKWTESNPDKYRETYKRWQKNNQQKIRGYCAIRSKEKCAANSRKYRATHPGKASEDAKRWRISNPDYRDPDKARDAYRRWRLNHPETARANTMNYMAAMRNAPGRGVTHTECFEKYGRVCLACGAAVNIHMDHVVPLSRGGAHDIDNVQPLCKHCNCSKGVKIIDYRSPERITE